MIAFLPQSGAIPNKVSKKNSREKAQKFTFVRLKSLPFFVDRRPKTLLPKERQSSAKH